jgi:hypothetical protein
MWTTKGEVMESPNLKARVICNPASSGGGHEPEELHRELEGYDLEWITTGSPGDATEAARSGSRLPLGAWNSPSTERS